MFITVTLARSEICMTKIVYYIITCKTFTKIIVPLICWMFLTMQSKCIAVITNFYNKDLYGPALIFTG